MTRMLLGAIGTALAVAGLARAAAPAAGPTPPAPDAVGALPERAAPCTACEPCVCEAGPPRVWVSGEYLLWWVKDAPLPVLGTHLDYGTFSGARLTAGGWLDCEGTVGLEASGFLLERRSAARSAAATAEPVTLPFVGTVTPAAALHSHTRLWGAEADGLVNALRDDGLHADLLAGFRFLSLEENLAARTSSAGTFQGAPLGLQTLANFQTQNEFYGGQLGVKAGTRWGGLSIEAVGKVVLGLMHEAKNMTALTSAAGPGFAASSGVVRRATRDEFAVLPEAELRAGYDVTEHAQVFVAYDFLYVSEVLRAGDNANTGRGIGPFRGSDFWAQGVSFGLGLQY